MAIAGVRSVRPWRRLLCGITKLYRLTTSQTFPPVARVAPGQTPGATPQGRYEPTQGAIPAFHEGGLDRLSELP